MRQNLHKYIRPQAQACFVDAFVGCAGNEPLQPGSPWHSPEEDSDYVVAGDFWEF